MTRPIRYLLLQVRNHDDAMRKQELTCFAQALCCDESQFRVVDFLHEKLARDQLDQNDVVLIGGSGHYGAVDDAPWLDQTLDGLREIHRLSKPTFGSCWGFQAMSRALGGSVAKDLENAELGTHPLRLTTNGLEDPVFGPLDPQFYGQMGHEDRVLQLPEDAILLASSTRVENQAYRFRGKPIYCTQFHPELTKDRLLERVRAYPEYVERISGLPYSEFEATCQETPQTTQLLARFVRLVMQKAA